MRDGRWQYKVESYKPKGWANTIHKLDNQLSERLNRLGMEGWELVAMKPHGLYTQFYLKRPF